MKTATNDPNHSPSAAVGKILLTALLALNCLALQAQPSALTGFYTQVAAGDPDFGSNPEILPTGMLQSQLGPNGLPVLSASGITTLGTSDINPTTHELLWWSPGQQDPYVSYDLNPVQVDTLPLNFGYPNPWYPTGQNSDANYLRTVHWEGTFDLATVGPVSFSQQVDDDVWLFVDGTLVNEDHYGYANNTTTDFSAGLHSINIFFDDRQQEFDQILLTSSVTLSPVPEPSVLALLGIGGAAYLARRRR